ncbi:ModD protein [Gluconacetobacter diazotrophicus]|uniref:ModD protein n=1 Tax=Gluconacetobacter diazotrophicus TaxID=33996 RepID=UPI0002F4CECD|nr:ModD protein [Gluconacetobacter diazotrophicus]
MVDTVSFSSSVNGLPPLPATLIDALLAEDVPFGDLTTRALGIGGQPGLMNFSARDEQVVCGSEEAAAILTRLGATVDVLRSSGGRVTPGTPLLRATGPAGALHMGWKTAQTLMEWAAGIATATNAIVLAAASGGAAAGTVAVACTRKAPPLTRALAMRAVVAGGGVMHRVGLSDTILVFPEHLAFMDPHDGLAQAVQTLRRTAPERRIVIEVTSPDQAIAAARAGADILQMEKFPVRDVARLAERLKALSLCPRLAAAGGINARNVADYVAAGADLVVTSAPYTAPPCDVQVELKAR